MTAPERPAGAVPIRQAAATDTEVRVLSLPHEPPVGSVVEVRAVEGYREGAWFRGPQGGADRPWTPTHMPDAPMNGRETWGALCEHALRCRCELWLLREGPLAEAGEGS